jgi:hypothetical protein
VKQVQHGEEVQKRVKQVQHGEEVQKRVKQVQHGEEVQKRWVNSKKWRRVAVPYKFSMEKRCSTV